MHRVYAHLELFLCIDLVSLSLLSLLYTTLFLIFQNVVLSHFLNVSYSLWLFCCCFGACVNVCVCLCTHKCVCVCQFQKLILEIFLSNFPPSLLWQGLSVNLDLTSFSIWRARSKDLPPFGPLVLRLHTPAFYVGTGDWVQVLMIAW